MENPTSFDLNRTIQQWRGNLAQSPAFQSDNLDELELHLRDSITTLKGSVLSEEEAFVVAARRIGGGKSLESEYEKVNSLVVWLDRATWIVLAMQVWFLIWSLSFAAVKIAKFGLSSTNSLPQGFQNAHRVSTSAPAAVMTFQVSMPIIVPTLLAIIASWLFYLFLKSKRPAIARLATLLTRPVKLTLIVSLFCVLVSLAIECVIRVLLPWLGGLGHLGFLKAGFIPEQSLLALTMLFLTRKRLQLNQT